MTPVVQLDAVSREFAGTAAVRELDLTVRRGEFTALLGPSGCGKTTTLRMIAGFLEPTAGRILLEGEDATRLPPERRNIGMVFQSYALFPHLTVEKNVAFGLRMRGIADGELRTRTGEALELVGLSHLAGRKPKQLSGGQQQRIALARAIAVRPSVLLLDEPLSNLDARLRIQMRQELARIQKETGITAILVTHDQEEALELADNMVILDQGTVAQQGAPREVFGTPANRFVAEFLGYENFVELPDGRTVTIRPEHVEVFTPESPESPESPTLPGGTTVDAVLTAVRFRGTDCVVTAVSQGRTVLATSGDFELRTGRQVRLHLPAAHTIDLPRTKQEQPTS
ncbi:putative spermidine/putrescine transport system ATP-binding protein [Streptomyces sp. LBL]|uniref:ABC transporter ATP-binding protein n=1 Tax=Streptomyces sp. LBL TaxID=2940562 RepID=UPI002473D7B3|nr:ABC transporter ATP-binding protein [Streptomyces sp. LBL]MDH6623167.1 putative spermidine/putrescine transport system ATP-binding protein [Streptomyces sp. LBL]